MSKTIGDGAAITMQKESLLQPRLPPRLLGLLCLKLPPAISGGMTKIPEGCESRLARIINSAEERKIRKWLPLPRCLEERERVGYSAKPLEPTVYLLTAKSLTVFYNHQTIRENGRGGF